MLRRVRRAPVWSVESSPRSSIIRSARADLLALVGLGRALVLWNDRTALVVGTVLVPNDADDDASPELLAAPHAVDVADVDEVEHAVHVDDGGLPLAVPPF